MCPGAMAAAPPSRSFLTRPVLIPIEVVRSGHIAIRAKINGQGPYRFIFDTGAPALVISPEVAKDSRILPRDFEKPFFTFLGNLGNFDVRSIALGRARQSNLQADIWNHPTVELMSKAYGRFEGLIGFPFFAHYQLTIDYKSKTMTLVPCAFEPVDTQQKMVGRLTAPQEPKSFAPKALLGVAVTKSKTDEDAGVVISAVSPGSPADDAGVKPGDRLLVLDGRWTDSVDDCYAALSAVESARQFTVVVLRHHQQISLVVHPARGL
jgi:membrane-associated protease RseP (regulator of RpoE activity)